MGTDHTQGSVLRTRLEELDAAIVAHEEHLTPNLLSLEQFKAERQGILRELTALDPKMATCQCRQCLRDRRDGMRVGKMFFPVEMSRMILCAECGNKRCPHATDHRHECTGSNEPGQAGSAYGGQP